MRTPRIKRWIVCALLLCALTACAGRDEAPVEAPVPTAAMKTPEPADLPASPEPVGPAETSAPVETVSLYGQVFPANAASIAIDGPVDDLAPLFEALGRFPKLREAALNRAVDPNRGLAASEAEWDALTEAYPGIAFTGGLLIGGEPVDTLSAYAVPASADAGAEIAAALRLCPALETLDVRAADVSRGTVAETAKRVRVLFTDAAYGASDSAAETLSFAGAQDPDVLTAYLCCFPKLKEIDLTETALSEEQGNALCDRFPALAVRRAVTLNGERIDSFSETLDFCGAKIASYEAFSDALRYFPKLERLIMHDCSLTNEQLKAIKDRYPEKGVVWTVHLGRWSVETDAVAFSTKQGDGNDHRLRSDKAQALRYCTDLIALDLGHNDLTDIEWIKELKNLQVLILADNRNLRDISAIGELKKLKYLELFLTSVGDISPLQNLSELLDVNLIYTPVKDITPLLSCKKLERIWLGEQVAARIGKEGAARLTDAFPNAQFDLISVGSTKLGWREHPRYFAFVRMFDENVPVDPFLP